MAGSSPPYPGHVQIFKRAARWIAVSTVGSLLVAIGVALLFLPGPGLLLIAAGLAVLSLEFLWAEELRERTIRRVRDVRRGRRRRPVDLEPRSSDRDPHEHRDTDAA